MCVYIFPATFGILIAETLYSSILGHGAIRRKIAVFCFLSLHAILVLQCKTASNASPPPSPVLSRRRDVMVAFSELELSHKIGSGATGSVWRGSWRGAAVAVKVGRRLDLL